MPIRRSSLKKEGSSVEIVRMPIAELNPQPPYQRALDEARVLRMAEDFDEHKLGVPEVIAENKNVVDGQHRVFAAQIVGLEEMTIRLHHGLSYSEEVALYRALNKLRRALRPIEDFKAALEEGDPDALALDEIVTRAGFMFSTTNTASSVHAVQTFRRMYRNGPETLRAAMEVIAPMRDLTEQPISGYVFEGVHVFLSEWGEKVDQRRLRQVMLKHRPEWWLTMAESNVNSERRAYRMASLIGNEYNKRLSKQRQLLKDLYG